MFVITDLLTTTIKSYPYVILESLTRLHEAFDYLMLLPLSTADGLLRSIQPLLKLSPTLRDGLVIILRKAIFSRFIHAGFYIICRICVLTKSLILNWLLNSQFLLLVVFNPSVICCYFLATERQSGNSGL